VPVANAKSARVQLDGDLSPQVRENAILIYGPRKAGTTLLQRLIDGSSVYVYPTELKVKQLSRAKWPNKATFLGVWRETDRLLHERVDGFNHNNFERYTNRTAAHAYSLREAILLRVEAAIKSSPGGEWTGWAAKDVGGDFGVILNDWKKMFLDSKFVVILRNPFFVSRSVFRKRYRIERQLGLKEIIKQIVQPWQILKAVAEHTNREDLYLVYYEDLVSHTEREMRSIARFLGVEFLPQLTYPTMFGKPTVVSTSTHQEASVFREKKPYWNSLRAREAVLLSLIGGGYCLANLARRRVTFSNGVLRLATTTRCRT
jgi:hypothetical protein